MERREERKRNKRKRRKYNIKDKEGSCTLVHTWTHSYAEFAYTQNSLSHPHE